MTLVVNLYGGPGTGKSTEAARLFAQLKDRNINCELAHEYAKEEVWCGNPLNFQPRIISEQLWRVHRLLGKVEVVITDSPILLGLIYGDGVGYARRPFEDFIVDTHAEWNTCNIFLGRDSDYHQYNPHGRTQTETEAKVVDREIMHMLDVQGIDYTFIKVGPLTGTQIMATVNECLASTI